MPNVNDDVMSVVDAYFQAWTSGDIEGALSHLSDDARCYAPEESIANKDDWRNFMQTFIPLLTGAPEHARMVDGDRVALWYFPQTEVTTTTLACELFTIRDGLIVETRVIFDSIAYTPPELLPDPAVLECPPAPENVG